MKRKNRTLGLRVVVKASENQKDYGIAEGAEGVITDLEPLSYSGEYPVAVEVAGGTFWFGEDDIKPAEKREKRPLKVGDKVTERDPVEWPPGVELTVTAVYEGNPTVYRVQDEEQSWDFPRSALRRVKSK